MSKGLAALISVLGAAGAGMSGYAKGRDQFQRGQREKMLDAREDEEYAYKQGERSKAQQQERDLADSQADIGIEEVSGDDGGYNMESMGGTGRAETAPVLPPSGFKVGAQSFADRGTAELALHGMNSRSAKDQRAAGVMRASGNPAMMDKARQYEEFASKAIDEGTDEILASIQAQAPSVEALKKAGGILPGTVGAQAAEVFNKKGSRWKVQPDTVVQHFITKDAAGREIVNSRVLGKDGKSVVDDVQGAMLMLADVKTRMAQKNKEGDQFQEGVKMAETARSHQATEGESRRHNRAQEGVAGATLAIARARDAREASQFKKQSLAGQLDELETVTGKLAPEERKKLGLQLAGLGKKGDDPQKDVNEMVNKLTEKFGETTTDPAAIAVFRDKLQKSITATSNNNQVEAALRTEFGGKQPGTPAYATTYNDAKVQLRMNDAQLTAMGYPPPMVEKASPARQVGTAIPAAPAAPMKPRRPWAEEVAEAQAAKRPSPERIASAQSALAAAEQALASGAKSAAHRIKLEADRNRARADLEKLTGS